MTETKHSRDRRAIAFPAMPGTSEPAEPRKVVVIGGGIAGLAAACGLIERGVAVDLIEPEEQLGGRVRAWNTESAAGNVTMSRGFHAFFRQYYNLRALLSRAGNLDGLLQPVEDYPVVSARGDKDSFSNIPRTPPWNFISFVMRSPTFSARDLTRVDMDTALSLLDVDFPETYRQLDGVSAADFLDRLHFPERARHLALEVFARSFFAHPNDFSAGEIVAMFHSYFLGSSEGLLFDVPRDDFETSLWNPLGVVLERAGVRRISGRVERLESDPADGRWRVLLADGRHHEGDAVVLAAGPEGTRQIMSASPSLPQSPGATDWRNKIEQIPLAPPFAVLRLWFDGLLRPDRPAFLGTADFGPLDNVSVLERFEAGARDWSVAHGGSVVELHAYAIPVETPGDHVREQALASQLRAELERVYPETAGLTAVAEELLIERDCALIGTNSWEERLEVRTPHLGLVLAGDWVRCDLPVALMERAATTGWMAANQLLESWGVAGHDLWSVPTRGRHWWPREARKLMARLPNSKKSR